MSYQNIGFCPHIQLAFLNGHTFHCHHNELRTEKWDVAANTTVTNMQNPAKFEKLLTHADPICLWLF